MTTCRARLWRSVVPALLMLSTVAMAEAGAQAQAASITVDDVLTLPNQSVRIEARVGEGTVGGGSALGGIALRLRVDGAAVATAKTDDRGRASFDFTPKMRGNHPMVVEQGESSGSDAGTTAKATLFVWERRRPILLVEVASLVEAGGGGSDVLSTKPSADAAEELTRLSQYYYNLVYIPRGEQSSSDTRAWLEAHQFPTGLVLMPLAGGLGPALDSFKQQGWTTMKAGIGRTKLFAETLLQHRVDVVLVPEPPKGDLPRKAKAAKDWKDVRKKL
ncbi:MAG: hypothetical protein NBKEAIPA_02233 [Nitrospirae bacterium]|nr:MAG: hypothetical protein UZ03_NOB001003266 [Nitrospira sp. OLB3]MBV6470318.1 hypothetical protein [Nitrospirota bacterium]MCE7964348.1 hypothetical protein [Nitrospira sp. NTP2]MCK6493344.1 hypothetical protein [Nitrospira sp.]MEB2337354.1 hypothetical protein [Nitrospirales bacterium]